MKRLLPFLLLLSALACQTAKPDYGRPLPPGSPALLEVDPAHWPDFKQQWREREQILPALDRSLGWTERKHAEQFFPQAGITHERALASLHRFRALLNESRSATEFELALHEEFTVYQSAGWDGRGGGVLFTGYCTPILEGRLEPDSEFQFPLYALPSDLVKGEDGQILGQQTESGIRPYPTRRAIEASAMLGSRNLELVWLRDPLDAYIAHVNGSAFVDIGEDSLYRLGYAGKNGRDYTSLGKELIADGKIDKDEVSLFTIRRWASQNPQEVEGYLSRNDSYVFFTPIHGNPRGSLNVEVEPRRTLATDKSLFPRGAVVFVDTSLPVAGSSHEQSFQQFMFDQDTGGAIRTAGRADIYVGIGPDAERVAGETISEGQLYYLFLRE